MYVICCFTKFIPLAAGCCAGFLPLTGAAAGFVSFLVPPAGVAVFLGAAPPVAAPDFLAAGFFSAGAWKQLKLDKMC